MWILSTSFRAAPELPDSTSPSNSLFLAAESSLKWNTKPLASLYWYRLWKRGHWTTRLFSQMSADLMGDLIVAQWIYSLLASRASHSLSRANGAARKTSAI